MSEEMLKNLAWHQKHLLIQRGLYVDELKEIWLKTWNIEYPYWTDCNNNIHEMSDPHTKLHHR